MDFSDALIHLKAGRSVCHSSWDSARYLFIADKRLQHIGESGLGTVREFINTEIISDCWELVDDLFGMYTPPPLIDSRLPYTIPPAIKNLNHFKTSFTKVRCDEPSKNPSTYTKYRTGKDGVTWEGYQVPYDVLGLPNALLTGSGSDSAPSLESVGEALPKAPLAEKPRDIFDLGRGLVR